jgi:mannosyltransferase OCH1-like enzyme
LLEHGGIYADMDTLFVKAKVIFQLLGRDFDGYRKFTFKT